MKNLDCNQIKIFINFEIIGKEKLYLFFLNIYKNFCNLVKPLGITMISKPNFYYIVYWSLIRAMRGKILRNTKISQLKSGQFNEKINITINVFGGLREI